MNPVTPFAYFDENIWSAWVLQTPERDVQSLACTSKLINTGMKNRLEKLLTGFFSLSFDKQSKQADWFARVAAQFEAINPEHPLHTLLAGELYRIHGLSKLSLKEFQKLDSYKLDVLSPIFPFITTARAVALLWKDNDQEAQKLLELSFYINCNYVPTLIYLFNILSIEPHQYDKALPYLKKASELDGKNPSVQMGMARAIFFGIGQSSDREKGKNYVQEALKQQEEKSFSAFIMRHALVRMYMIESNSADAFQEIQTLLKHPCIKKNILYRKLNMDSAKLFLDNTETLAHLSTVHHALSSLKKASKTDNISDLCDVAESFLHKNLRSRRNYEGALELCNKVIEKDPSCLYTRWLRSSLVAKKQPLVAIEDLLYLCCDKDTTDHKVRNMLIKRLILHERTEEKSKKKVKPDSTKTIEFCCKELQEKPNDLKAHRLRGRLLALLGTQLEVALEDLRFCWANDETDSLSRKLLINLLTTNEMTKETVEEIVKLDPTSPSTADLLVEKILQQKPNKELCQLVDAHLHRMLQIHPLNTDPSS